jgi:hypothetical protein
MIEVLGLTNIGNYFAIETPAFAFVEAVVAIVASECVVIRYYELNERLNDRYPRGSYVIPLLIIPFALFTYGIALALNGNAFPLWPPKFITTSSLTVTTSSTVVTPVAVPAIPGFTPESVLLGLLVGFFIILALRHRRSR